MFGKYCLNWCNNRIYTRIKVFVVKTKGGMDMDIRNGREGFGP
jgi:hypothetical protein